MRSLTSVNGFLRSLFGNLQPVCGARLFFLCDMKIEFKGHEVVTEKITDNTYKVKCRQCSYVAVWTVDLHLMSASVVIENAGDEASLHAFQIESALANDFGDQRN